MGTVASVHTVTVGHLEEDKTVDWDLGIDVVVEAGFALADMTCDYRWEIHSHLWLAPGGCQNLRYVYSVGVR